MPKLGLKLNLEQYNQISRHRYLAKKRKDSEARTSLRAIFLVHERKTIIDKFPDFYYFPEQENHDK